MTFKDLEICFNRALLLSLTKRKFIPTFIFAILCGVLTVFCKALALEVSDWIAMSLAFLPILLSLGLFFSLGVLLVRVYYHEVKDLDFDLKKILLSSWELIVGSAYLVVPSILLYLIFWMFLGIFLLFREIPYVGEIIGLVLIFAPFLLIFGSIVLCFVNLLLLFFACPMIAFGGKNKLKAAQGFFSLFKKNIFTGLIFFLLALLPIAIVGGLLSLAAVLTGGSYLISEGPISVAVGWFFIMLPFCFFTTPCVTFFFNMSTECYNFLSKK